MMRWLYTFVFALLVFPAVSSAAWLPPGSLSSGGAPALAVAERAPGGAFGPPRDLSAAGRDAFSPALAVDHAGNVTLAWMQGAGFVVQARYRPAGGDWGEATPPLSLGPIANGPAVAVGDG